MPFHTRIVNNPNPDPDLVRQLIHEFFFETLSEDDEQELQPSLTGTYLILEPVNGQARHTLDLFKYAEAHVELINGFFGRSRTSGNDGWDALNFGFSQWLLLRTYGTDETEGEYINPGDNLEKILQDKQRDWIGEGNWTSSALTEFSARDLTEPWLLRELAENNDLLYDLDLFTDSQIGTGDVIPEELVDIAIEYWDLAVRNEPDDDSIVFGKWDATSAEFDAWLNDHASSWRDTGEPLTLPGARALRTACLRLGMLETSLYAF